MPKDELVTIADLKNFLQTFFEGSQVGVFLFGSRARKNASRFSDIDIGLVSNVDISREITLLKETIEESNIPYKVDIVDLSRNRDLLETVLKEGERWL